MARSAVQLLHAVLGEHFPMTKLYLGLCVLVFALTSVSGGVSLLGLSNSEALRWGALFYAPGARLTRQEPWRYLSAMFVHSGLLHIFFNGTALWDFGRATERRLGSARFVIVFILTGVAGFVLSELWYSWRAVAATTLGASGGLFGLIGCLIGYLYARKDPVWKDFLIRVVVFSAILAIALPVNNAAHFGGFACGVPLGYLFYRERRPWRRNAVLAVIAGLLVLASFASIGLSYASPVWRAVRQAEIERGMIH
ncbi:MAG TPA: rhomboid family intramembrane serine protease [Polyangiaceae bacterium]